MPNPFDEFDRPTSSKSNPFDEFDVKPEESWGDKALSAAKGVGTAALDVVGGVPGFLAGLTAGIGTAVVHGDPTGGLDLSKEVMGKALPSSLLGIDVSGNKGYQYAMKPLEWFNDALGYSASGYGEIAHALGASENAVKAVNSTAELALLAGTAGMGGKKLSTAEGVPTLRDPSALKAELNTPTLKNGQQGNLFDQFDTSGYASPYDAGQIGVSEPIQPKRANAQMNFQLEHPETLRIDSNQVATPDSQAPLMDIARNSGMDRMTSELDAAYQEHLKKYPEDAPKQPIETSPTDVPAPPPDRTDRYKQVQDQLAARQQELELAVAKQHSLDFNAAERARQNNAPTMTDSMREELAIRAAQAAREVETAKAAQESALMDAKAEKDKAFLNARQQDVFEGNINQYRPYTDMMLDDGKGGQRPMSLDEFHSTLDALTKEKSTAFTPPADVPAAYSHYLDTVGNTQKGLFDVGSKSAAYDAASTKAFITKSVEAHPSVLKADSLVAKQEQAISDMREQVKAGTVRPSAMTDELGTLEKLQDRASTIRGNIEKSLQDKASAAAAYANGTWVPKSQKGAVKVDWRSKDPLDQLTKVPGMDQRMKNILVDKMTDKEFLEAHQNTPDMNQNAIQKAMNFGTKGISYMVEKTSNPLLKRAGDRFMLADNRSRAAIQEIVHDKMEPLARTLNDTEKADAWAATQIANFSKKPLTPEIMARYGFNEKQIAWATNHVEVMGKMFEKMTGVMKAAGLEVVDPQVAYAAAHATGDFRRLVHETKENAVGEPVKSVVHILGENTRGALDKATEKYQALYPTHEIGAEQYFGGGGKGGQSEGFSQMLEFLSKNDLGMKEYVDRVNAQASMDAFNYMNMKSHTMEKKGITGMSGNKINLDTLTPDRKQTYDLAVQNAKEGMQAQVHYTENMIKWNELSQAVTDTKPLLSPDNGLNMPNAKKYLQSYIDNALGKSPAALGKLLDATLGEAGKMTGLGTTIGREALNTSKHITNSILLGMRPLFVGMQWLQPLRAMPSLTSRLKSMGLEKQFDLNTGYKYLAKAGMDMYADAKGLPVDPVIRDALQYAKDNHVYSSNLFETGGDVSNTLTLKINKITQYALAPTERYTRQAVFLGMVRMLDENGVTKGEGLFEAAHRQTDFAMNNYSKQEMPLGYAALGSAGKLAYNLMSYKQSELSRLSMMAREMKTHQAYAPMATELLSQVAFAGIKGTILYNEADELVRYIADKMGKPTSLTHMLLNSNLPQVLTHGVFAALGGDMSGQLGTAVVPGSLVDTISPGSGKLVDIAKQAGTALYHHNAYSVERLANTALPGVLASGVDRAFLSKKNGMGEEQAFNKQTVESTAIRNNTDKVWKTLGGTGINESIQKAKSYEDTDIKTKYSDYRKDTLNRISEEFYTNNKVSASSVNRYINEQGGMDTLSKDIAGIAESQKVPKYVLQTLHDAMSNSITASLDLKRRMGK